MSETTATLRDRIADELRASLVVRAQRTALLVIVAVLFLYSVAATLTIRRLSRSESAAWEAYWQERAADGMEQF